MMKRREFIQHTISGISVLGLPIHGNTLSASTLPTRDQIALRFAVASDGHYGQSGTEYDQFHDDLIAWLNQDTIRKPLAFTVFNGDLIHDEPAQLAILRAKLERLIMPFYVTRGNHDRCHSRLWESTWGYGLNHSLSWNNCAIMLLDTSDINGSYLCPDVGWVDQEFRKYQNVDHLFVFMHITPRKWTDNGVRCKELRALFAKQRNLRAVFHGHDHDQDGAMFDKGKPYLFDGHFGGSWGVGYRGYRVVEVLHSGTVVTYQVNAEEQVHVNRHLLE